LIARVVGFDAPELHGQCEEETLLARWARHRLEELVCSPVVRLDLVDCPAGHRDRYRRLCGILYANSRDVSQTMIREGLARPYVCDAGHCPQRQPGALSDRIAESAQSATQEYLQGYPYRCRTMTLPKDARATR
jgi:endonuclease YncB( thermonuclease family)